MKSRNYWKRAATGALAAMLLLTAVGCGKKDEDPMNNQGAESGQQEKDSVVVTMPVSSEPEADLIRHMAGAPENILMSH